MTQTNTIEGWTQIIEKTHDQETSEDEFKIPAPPPVNEEEFAVLTPEQKEALRATLKPNIDHLVDAVVLLEDGTRVFVPEVREKLVIERRSTLSKQRPWLDTRVWMVNSINNETGEITLWDPDLMQHAKANFKADNGYRFKLMPVRGSVFKRRKRELKPGEKRVRKPRVEKEQVKQPKPVKPKKTRRTRRRRK